MLPEAQEAEKEQSLLLDNSGSQYIYFLHRSLSVLLKKQLPSFP